MKDHLTRAAEYIAKGDGWYGKAADEIIAERKENDTSYSVIAKRLGKSQTWCKEIVSWRTSGLPDDAPVDWHRGMHATKREIEDGAKRLLKDAPLEQVERIIADLPRERQDAIGAVAGNPYLRVRQQLAEEERDLTPAQRREREAARDAITFPVRKATASFLTLGIAGHIDQATEELRELVADGSLTSEAMAAIDEAFEAFVTEYQVARAMVGLDAWEGAPQ